MNISAFLTSYNIKLHLFLNYGASVCLFTLSPLFPLCNKRLSFQGFSCKIRAVMHEMISIWMSWVMDWGYAGITILMAMESSIFPVPSEVVIPPAAILSAQEGASMSFWGVVLAGTFGSWLGSAITYAVARIVGRPFIMRWGKYFFMPAHKVEKAEIFLQRYEVSGVFFARLLPVIRHLISIPAGIVRMGFGIFSFVTVLGSFAWCSVLAWYGHRIGERHPELLKSPEELIHTVKSESLPLILAVLVLAVCYILMLRLTDRSKTEGAPSDSPEEN